jgi:aspartyl-tRNA(Asn)/glutamyl-tRNA(Gln) amidotransferase subunit A
VKSPRLKGAVLRRARALTALPAFRELARKQAFTAYDVEAMLALPADSRSLYDVTPRPVAGAPPRKWHDARRKAPAPAANSLSASALTAGFTAGKLDPVGVLEAIFARIDSGQFGESVHSPFVALDRERAMGDARASADRYRRGAPLGPLDGVPTHVKDQHNLAGLATCGGTSFQNAPDTSDGIVVSRLREAGALVFGKTHCTEWGMQPTGFNPNFSMPRNPYSRDHGAGGSSTGTGAAVALGLGALGIGSDGGGSIRIPASLCGVFGIKPTYLRIGRTGDIWRNSSVAHNGPLGASVSDLVALLGAVGGEPDPDDYLTQWAPPGFDWVNAWTRALGRGARGARIGVVRALWDDASRDIAAACENGLRVLEAAGAKLVDVDIPLVRHAPAIGVVTIGTETMGTLTDVMSEHAEQSGDDLRLVIQILEQVSAREFFHAQRTRAVLRRQVAAALADVDVLAMPTTNMPAPRYSLSEDGVAVSDDDATKELTRYAFLANLMGLPAGTAPVGRIGGLPVGLQLMGDAWDEASVLALMAELERSEITKLPPPAGRFTLGA